MSEIMGKILCVILFSVILLPVCASGQDKPEIFVQLGHTGQVMSIAFHPDGKRILTGSQDKSIKIWELETGREIKTILGHEGEIHSIAVSKDGRYVASGSYDRTVRLWNLEEGKEIRRFYGHSDTVLAVALSADGKYAASGSSDRTIKIWDLDSGAIVRTLKGHANSVRSVAISPCGRYLLSGGDDNYTKRDWDNVLILWDVETGRKIRTFKGNPRYGDVISVGFISERFAFSLSDTIRIWDITTGSEKRSFGEPAFFYSSAASPVGKHIAVGGKGELFLWDVSSGRLIKKFSGDFGTVTAVAFSRDGRSLAIGDIGGRVSLWATHEGVEMKSFGRSVSIVFSVSFSPDKHLFVSGSADGTIRLWDINKGELIRTLRGHRDWILAVAFHPAGGQVLSCSGSFFGAKDPTIRTWNVRTGEEIATFYGHAETVRSLAVAPDGMKVITASWDGTLKLWDTSIPAQGIPVGAVDPGAPADRAGILKGDFIVAIDGAPVHSWRDFVDIVNKSPGRNLNFMVRRGNRTFNVEVIPVGEVGRVGISLGDISTKTYRGHSSYVNSVSISPDGKLVASGSSDKTVKIWDMEKGSEIRTLGDNESEVTSVTFSPDGRKILYGGNKILTLRDTEGKWKRVFTGHSNWIYAVAYSPDGRKIASGSYDGTVKLWDAESSREVQNFKGHESHIESVTFSADGKRLLSASHDGTTRLWDIQSGKEVARFIAFKDGEWIVITPEGYFNASPKGAQHLNVRVGNKVYSIDNFYEKFFNPVYVASVLQGKKVEAVADIRKGILTPPEVKISSPEPNKEFDTDTITITVSAKDTGGGIDEIRLYHNGKAIGEDRRAVKIVPQGNEVVKNYTVTLVDGINTFRAIGFSKDRTESNPYELIVKFTGPSKEASLYILAVGINNYKNHALNLNYAEPDAKGLTEFFRQKGKSLFKKVEIVEIYNEHATKENITSQLKQLEKTSPKDVVLIYIAGHGESIGDKWYLIPHELTYPEREEEVKAKGISSGEFAELIKSVRAQKILVLVDACKSGAVLVAFRGFEDRKALFQLSRSTGVHVIAASTKDQFAAEVKDLGHGVFTYTLLEGLKGKAASGGEAVTVFKLRAYLEEQLPEISKKYKQETQWPVGASSADAMDFPLVLVK